MGPYCLQYTLSKNINYERTDNKKSSLAVKGLTCQQMIRYSVFVWSLFCDIVLDWLQSLKQYFINVSYNILVASHTLMALFSNRTIRIRLATSISYDTLIIICFKDWSQSNAALNVCFF